MRDRISVSHAYFFYTPLLRADTAAMVSDAFLYQWDFLLIIMIFHQNVICYFCTMYMMLFIETVIRDRGNIMQPCSDHDNFLIRSIMFCQKRCIFDYRRDMVIAPHSKFIRRFSASIVYFFL